MRDKVVVDASLAIKWVIDEPYTSEALALLSEWGTRQVSIIAPSLLTFEAVNAIYKRVSRNQLSLGEARRALADLLLITPVLDHEPDIHIRALELAHQFNQRASYDAHYLALAGREGCPYWTADERLWNTVRDRLAWVHWIGEYHPSPS